LEAFATPLTKDLQTLKAHRPLYEKAYIYEIFIADDLGIAIDNPQAAQRWPQRTKEATQTPLRAVMEQSLLILHPAPTNNMIASPSVGKVSHTTVPIVSSPAPNKMSSAVSIILVDRRAVFAHPASCASNKYCSTYNEQL
jgi:hypothetical protein